MKLQNKIKVSFAKGKLSVLKTEMLYRSSLAKTVDVIETDLMVKRVRTHI